VREAGVIESHGRTRRPQSHVCEPGQVREFGADRLGSDSLTGAGVRAPSSIPEIGTEVTELRAWRTRGSTN
jgi:hypothetical protein